MFYLMDAMSPDFDRRGLSGMGGRSTQHAATHCAYGNKGLACGILSGKVAMQPGVSGAHKAGIDGLSPDNAGAGLFITRAIAKATGGYFVLMSGTGAFRLRRCPKKDDRGVHFDAFTDPRKDLWKLPAMWQGTVAAVEVVTEEIPSFSNFFKWIIRQIPAKKTTAGKIKFT